MERYDIKYDNNGNMIYWRDPYNNEFTLEFDENNNCIYFKNSNDKNFDYYEKWSKFDKNNKQIQITEKEYKEIEFRKKEKEYLSREKVTRFEIMEI